MESTVRAILNYQFGNKIGDKLFDKYEFEVEISKNTGRIRRVYVNDKLFGTVEASTGFIILTFYGAQLVKDALPYPKYRVAISKEAVPFVAKGKSVFAKFVKDVDEEILPKDVVLVVDEKDNLIATGVAMMSAKEMRDFDVGVAVKVKYARDSSKK